jgi:hypothetical protein
MGKATNLAYLVSHPDYVLTFGREHFAIRQHKEVIAFIALMKVTLLLAGDLVMEPTMAAQVQQLRRAAGDLTPEEEQELARHCATIRQKLEDNPGLFDLWEVQKKIYQLDLLLNMQDRSRGLARLAKARQAMKKG